MNTVLKEYLERRLKPTRIVPKQVKKMPGPVITISRDYGCPAKRIAGMLSATLNRLEIQSDNVARWYWLGKEIMEESARELHLRPELVNEIAKSEDKNILEEILLAFTNKYYPGDIKIKKTIGEIIHTYATTGHVIVVGRGGAAICRDIKKALHIKLTAPLAWRINDVSRRHNLTLAEAEKRIKSIDHQRELLRKFFSAEKTDNAPFDVVFNYMTCSDEEIVQSIVKIAEMRDLL